MKETDSKAILKEQNSSNRPNRVQLEKDRFKSFVLRKKNSDLLIGIDRESYHPKIEKYANKKFEKIQFELEKYLEVHTEFEKSFTSVKALSSAPIIAKAMSIASMKAQTGPMAALNGAFSQFLGKALLKKFNIKEIIVENAGDIFISIQKELFIPILTGNLSQSKKVGIVIKTPTKKLGICTSNGTIGPSFSFGKAEAVLVVCEDTLLADAYATAIANEVRTAEDIDSALQFVDSESLIQTALVVCEEKIGIKGKHELIER